MKQHVTTWMAFGLGLSLMTGCSNEFFQNANGGSSLNPTSDTAGCGGGCWQSAPASSSLAQTEASPETEASLRTETSLPKGEACAKCATGEGCEKCKSEKTSTDTPPTQGEACAKCATGEGCEKCKSNETTADTVQGAEGAAGAKKPEDQQDATADTDAAQESDATSDAKDEADVPE